VPAFDKGVTADTTDAMTHVVTEGTGQKAQSLDRPAAGKTGTSTDNKAVWFDGFTPQLAAAVGIYQGKGTKTIEVQNFGQVTGGTYPTEIWTAFMKDALAGAPVVDFPPREGVGDNKLPPPPPPPPPTTQAPAPTTTTIPTSTQTTSTFTPSPTTPSPTRTRRTRPGPTFSTGPPPTAPAASPKP